MNQVELKMHSKFVCIMIVALNEEELSHKLWWEHMNAVLILSRQVHCQLVGSCCRLYHEPFQSGLLDLHCRSVL